jgi:hypothetical protein
VTAAPYSVFQGFAELFEDFDTWLAASSGCRVHGHVFAPERSEFASGQKVINGALPDSAKLRDHNPQAFLTNLIWNTRGERQCFQYGPRDLQANNWFMAKDPNAQISIISGAWAIPLFKSNRNFGDIRQQAAKLQKIESDFLDVMRSPWVKARVRVWTMAEFIEAPMEPLQTVIDEIGKQTPRRLAEAPRMTDLTGFGQFLQNLKNQGMHPYLMGDFSVAPLQTSDSAPPRKPYLVQ